MTNKIYIGNLPYDMEEVALKTAFTQFGEIVDVKIVKDRESGKSRGFGFITYSSPEDARNALVMGGQLLQNRKLFVKFARERQNYRSTDPMSHNVEETT